MAFSNTDQKVEKARSKMKCPEIQLKDVIYDKDKDFLGGGGYGEVFKARYKDMTVAFKVIEKEFRFNQVEKIKLLTCKEANAMCSVAHPSISKLHGIVLDKPSGLVLDYMEYGSIRDLLNKEVDIPDCLKVEIMLDIASAMKYLHSEGHVHADLKLGNILMNDKLQAKLGDFGVTLLHGITSNITGKMKDKGRGTIHYMAPELFNPELVGLLKIKNSKESDVWSFGVTVFELLKGVTPLQDLRTEVSIIDHILKRGLQELCRSELNGVQPAVLVKVALKCLEYKAQERITFEEIWKELHNDYINNHYRNRIEGVRQLLTVLKPSEPACDEVPSFFGRDEVDFPIQQELGAVGGSSLQPSGARVPKDSDVRSRDLEKLVVALSRVMEGLQVEDTGRASAQFGRPTKFEPKNKYYSVKQQKLLDNKVTFRDNLLPASIFDHLIQEGHMTIDDMQRIKREGVTVSDQSSLLVDFILCKDDKAIDVLCYALRQEGQGWLAEKIEWDDKQPLRNKTV